MQFVQVHASGETLCSFAAHKCIISLKIARLYICYFYPHVVGNRYALVASYSLNCHFAAVYILNSTVGTITILPGKYNAVPVVGNVSFCYNLDHLVLVNDSYSLASPASFSFLFNIL